MYRVPERRESASWKSWGGVQTHEAASAEAERISLELKTLASGAEFPLSILPVARLTSAEEAERLRGPYDAVVLFPATGSGDTLRACLALSENMVIFVRHRSGPAYYWYEALSTRYLQPRRLGSAKGVPAQSAGVSVDDVVVDDMSELAGRLRALYAVRNFLGSRVIALGGTWGKYAAEAPEKAKQKFNLEIIDVSYDDLGKRTRSVWNDAGLVSQAEQWTSRYTALPGTRLETDRKFVVNAFLLYGVFKELLKEHGASIFTINRCMGTILPMAQTTACLTLSLLNDEGLVAFCESDFVIIPAGILLHYVAGKPVFLHNSTFPHKAVVTCAHCTSPRRMDGAHYEPARVLTHYESEYGAAPKVEMPIGQEVTFINPEYATGRWVGMRGTVEGNPFYDICRSQQDVRIQGDWKRLLDEVRDSHWVMAYGNWLLEAAYAAGRIGIEWDAISD
ncbi:MAG: sugar isomerase [Acidobacteria bacterium]|nr:sugar isomerase [Acidobacteriota bacterium]